MKCRAIECCSPPLPHIYVHKLKSPVPIARNGAVAVIYTPSSRTHMTKKRARLGYSRRPVLGFIRQGRKILRYPGRSSGQSVSWSFMNEMKQAIWGVMDSGLTPRGLSVTLWLHWVDVQFAPNGSAAESYSSGNSFTGPGSAKRCRVFVYGGLSSTAFGVS